MFITQAYKGLYEFWRYIIGTLITFIMWQLVGAIPLAIVLLVKVFQSASGSGMSFPEVLESDLMPTSVDGMVTLLGGNLFLFMMIVSFAFGLLGILFSNKVLHKLSFLSLTTSRSKIDWKRIFVGFTIVIVFNLATFAVGYFLAPDALEWNFNLQPFLILLVICLLFLPIQTSFEEYLFRGYLMQGIGVNLKENKFIPLLIIALSVGPVVYFILHANLQLEFWTNLGTTGLVMLVLVIILDQKSKTNPTILHRKWVPLLFTSVIFGVLHAANPEVEKLGYISMVYYIGTGLILGIMTLMDDGMELALGYHAGNNILTALLVTTDWSALQTDAVFVDTSEPSTGFFDIIFPVLIIYPIMLLILAKIYKWKNWKEKLFGIVSDKTHELDEMQATSEA
ncbi:CPBP family glutamic-type intramembrane protease [Kordia sp.]|uniref:CPBP family glutamic-type intramembrane protease n=1 Tax=Kordia sp. TaxID=1965332 RepID=UPI003D290757